MPITLPFKLEIKINQYIIEIIIFFFINTYKIFKYLLKVLYI